jgi:hypothetical protein
LKSAAEEIKLWKENQSNHIQEILKLRDLEIEKKDKLLKSLREKLHHLEHFGKRNYVPATPTSNGSASTYSSYSSQDSQNSYVFPYGT